MCTNVQSTAAAIKELSDAGQLKSTFAEEPTRIPPVTTTTKSPANSIITKKGVKKKSNNFSSQQSSSSKPRKINLSYKEISERRVETFIRQLRESNFKVFDGSFWYREIKYRIYDGFQVLLFENPSANLTASQEHAYQCAAKYREDYLKQHQRRQSPNPDIVIPAPYL